MIDPLDVLDNSDVIQTRPGGFDTLSPTIGDKVKVEIPARRLVTSTGRAIETHRVNVMSLARAG